MRRALLTATTLLTAAVVSGCASGAASSSRTGGSAAARRLLAQTFGGHHTITSGVVRLDLKLAPSGSSPAGRTFELSFGGPFMSRGAGRLPESDFTIVISAQGHHAGLQVISAGGRAYITLAGHSYRMPASSYRRLASGFGAVPGAGRGSGSGLFAKLGISPLRWLEHPRIVGQARVGGAATTEIRGRLDAGAMLQDLSTLLGKAGSLGVSGAASLPHGIPQATRRSIARALGSPRVTVWTGSSDKLLRRLRVAATVPVTGRTRTLLGGMRAARVTFGLWYSQINQHQRITAPAAAAPFSAFRAEVKSFLNQLMGSMEQRYTSCITAAGGDVAKMQKCAALLSGG